MKHFLDFIFLDDLFSQKGFAQQEDTLLMEFTTPISTEP